MLLDVWDQDVCCRIAVKIRRCWETFRVIAKNQANKIPNKIPNFPTEKKEKIGPPGENTELLILKKENKAAGGTQYERLRFKMLWTQDSGYE